MNSENMIPMHKMIISILATIAGFAGQINAQNVCSDYWAATDGLGRKVGQYPTKEQDKTVILFYWTWHNNIDQPGKEVKNIHEILRDYPEAIHDSNHPAWHEKRSRNDFYWDEPLFGYYMTTDTWVLRKHAELLADAGVDAVMFDCTNGHLTWDESTDSLMFAWDKAQKEGVKVPRIGFMLPFGPSEDSRISLRHLYEKIYSKHLYENLWFVWDGKPCIMAYPDNLTDSPTDRAIRDFFTFRPGQPDYVNGPNPNYSMQWGWLENYPQHGYNPDDKGQYELVTVGVAQNAAPETNGHCSAFNLPGAHSRSYTYRKGFDPRPDNYLYGANFEEQWDRAYELDPKAVFIDGWNEWIGGMWFEKDGWTGKPFSFVDMFDWDRSRDIEPVKSWGEKGDSYYMMLVDKVRRFKGTQTQETCSKPQSIGMGEWEAWDSVHPIYTTYRGNTLHRDARGKCDNHYINTTGRNDFTEARVARDDKYVYFLIETAEAITPSSDPNWMMLFLDIDRDKSTGWNGYDYVINYRQPKGNTAYIQKARLNKWLWQDAGTAKMKVHNNQMMLRIPRALLQQQDKTLNFEFKWSDNMQDEGNLMDFYVNGDVAPGARFNYVFSE